MRKEHGLLVTLSLLVFVFILCVFPPVFPSMVLGVARVISQLNGLPIVSKLVIES